MSIFDSIAANALDTIQGVFSESVTVTHGSTDTVTRAIFEHQTVEINGVQSVELTAQFLNSDFSIAAGDFILRTKDDTYWRVASFQDEEFSKTAVLKVHPKPLPPPEPEEE